MVLFCHRAMVSEVPYKCMTDQCSMWNEAEEECLEVFILRDKARKIWMEEEQ